MCDHFSKIIFIYHYSASVFKRSVSEFDPSELCRLMSSSNSSYSSFNEKQLKELQKFPSSSSSSSLSSSSSEEEFEDDVLPDRKR
jgi:hypothetical protein